MGFKSNFGRFRDGVQISGIDLSINQKGIVRYVCNSSVVAPKGISGDDSNDGKTPERPLATIAQAVTLCTANRGDKIVLLPGHAETITAAAGISLSKAGISIIGVGEGSQRPTLTYTTANTATLAVSANDISITNVLFVGNFLAIAKAIALTTAKNFRLDGCEFRDTDATHGFVKAVATDSTDNHADGLMVTNCVMNGTGTTAATSFINLLGVVDRLVVSGNVVQVQGTTATTGVLILATSKAMTAAQIDHNRASSLYTGSAGALIVAGSGCTGTVSDNCINITGGGTDLLCTASTGLGFFNNFLQGAADASGYLLPASDV